MDIQFKRSPKARKCCVSNCPNKFNKMHRFPKSDPEIFNIWVQRIKPPNFENLSILEIYNKYYVCNEHFSPDFFVVGTKRGLTRDAIPSLNIPGFHNIDIYEDTVESTSNINQNVIPSCSEANTEPLIYYEEVAGPSTAANFSISVSPHSIPNETVELTVARHGQKEAKCKIGFKIRRRILADINVSRAVDLTPKAKKLYHRMSSWSIQMARMQNGITSYKHRLTNCKKFVDSAQFDNLLKYVNNSTYNFLMCQIQNQQLERHARRYSLDEKILALSIAKGSGKAYRLLSKIFVLPTVRTLSNLLKKIPFGPGLNKYVFLSLQNNVKEMKRAQDKLCILMFEEMSIDIGLFYNSGQDCILGFEDDGEERTARLANHVNVFLLKGIYRQWKQPIAFTFSCGPVKATKLKVMIKRIILECQRIGLEVVTTVCDQGSSNQSAIKTLLEESRRDALIQNVDNSRFGFVIEGEEIIPLYDVPHLMKELRNNLLNKDLHFVLNGEKKVAKWSHIEEFYTLDCSQLNLRMCSKLTDAHIVKEKINKMKVKNCTQVFSHTVGTLMKRISRWDIKDNNNLSEEVGDTADLILFLDNLFDSLNVSSSTKQDAKPLKWPITNMSQHGQFWTDSLSILRSMKYYCLKKKAFVSTPTLRNFIFTLERIIYLKDILLKNKNFKYILSRVFNQDSLENFFGYIRSHGCRNINPDVPHFITSFKTLILNNFMASHSPGFNCEEDMGSEGLDNMRSFLTGEIIPGVRPMGENTIELPVDIPIQGRTKVAKCTLVYISGYIGKILQKDIRKCENCQQNISIQHTTQVDEDFVECRQYDRGNLIRPGNYLYFLVSNSLCSLFYLIPRLGIKNSISKILVELLLQKFSFTPINCPEHKLGDRLCTVIVRCALFWWCKNVTKIGKGKDNTFSKFLAKNSTVNIDPIKLHAYKLYRSRKRFQKKTF